MLRALFVWILVHAYHASQEWCMQNKGWSLHSSENLQKACMEDHAARLASLNQLRLFPTWKGGKEAVMFFNNDLYTALFQDYLDL